MTKTPPPRYNDRLDLWLVRDQSGDARAFATREQAEISARHGETIYRGPAKLGKLIDVCELVEVRA